MAMQGRVHFYEGYAPWQVAFPARVLCSFKPRALVGEFHMNYLIANLVAVATCSIVNFLLSDCLVFQTTTLK